MADLTSKLVLKARRHNPSKERLSPARGIDIEPEKRGDQEKSPKPSGRTESQGIIQ